MEKDDKIEKVEVIVNLKTKNYSDLELVEFTKENIPYGWKLLFNSELLEILEDTEDTIKRLIEDMELEEHIDIDGRTYTFFPHITKIYNAFLYTKPHNLRVVIFGQDPYEQYDEETNYPYATGSCFSTVKTIGYHQIRPSLKNIFKELSANYPDIAYKNNLDKNGNKRVCKECGIHHPSHGDISNWGNMGILLLNTSLQVIPGNAGSLLGAWSSFATHVVDFLNDNFEGLIFVAWGNPAQKVCSTIDETKHYVLKSSHPSPLGANRGFFGCGHFKQINEILSSRNDKEIDWGNF